MDANGGNGNGEDERGATGGDEDDGDLMRTLDAWLDTPTYRAERRYLEEHPSLLDPPSDAVLGELIQRYAGQRQREDDLREHLILLRDIRARRRTQSETPAIRDGYVNAYGGLTLDVPEWLEAAQWQVVELERAGQAYQTAAARIALLREAVARARADISLPPPTVADLQVSLWDALDDSADARKRERQEEGIPCLKAALETYTLARYPRQYATTQNNLGIIYQARIAGGRRDNLEAAITAYQQALRIFTLAAFPVEYARTQNNLGNVYQDRIAGAWRDNLEQAIAAYSEALRVRTLDAFPLDYATTQNNLGAAYRNRIAGERRDNLERAIAAYGEALRVYTYEAFPAEYATTQHNLGVAYRDRIVGARRDNLEAGLAAYQEALRVRTYEAFPTEYAQTQNNLGNLYQDRIAGTRRDNLERAIAAYQETSRVHTYEAFPANYAITQNNLGNAYRDRIAGARGDNLERAIAAYGEALRVHTLAAFPADYATTQNNLGNAYAQRLAGERRDNLERAIAAYNEALRVRTYEAFPVEYAAAQNNLGNLYQERIAGERRDNLERAIIAYQEALRVYTYEAHPINYATTQNNLGVAYRNRITGARRDNLEAAITACQQVLRVRTLAALPRDHRGTQVNLALAEAEYGDWAAAADAYTGALAAEDLLAALEGSVAGLDALVREGRSAAARGGFALARLGRAGAAAMLIERGRARGLAAALAQNAADPALIGDAARRARYTAARAALRTRQAELNEEVAAEGKVYLLRNQTYNQAKADFDAVVAEVRAAGDPADFLQPALDEATLLRAAVRGGAGHALVYLLATPWGGAAVAALAPNPAQRTAARFTSLNLSLLTDALMVDLIEKQLGDGSLQLLAGFGWAQEGNGFARFLMDWPGETLNAKVAALRAAAEHAGQDSTLLEATDMALRVPAFADLARRPLAAIEEDKAERQQLDEFAATFDGAFLRLELARCLPMLADAALRPLAAWLDEQGATSLTLVPCGALAAFPLLAAEVAPGQTLAETLPASIAPSARSLLGTDEGQHAGGTRAGVYAVGDPWPTHQPLTWGEAEALALAALARRLGLPGQAHSQHNATRDRLIAGLTGARVVDASCHGLFTSRDPLESALFLARGERLTLRDALSHAVELRGLRLLILSACQTGILDLRGAHDEVRSLAAGMLQAGAAAVLAAQWAVNDRATYLLMVRFAQEWLPRMAAEPPAAALARAQRWLRHVTNAELRRWQALVVPPETLAHCTQARPARETPDDDSQAQAAIAAAEALVLAGASPVTAGAGGERLVAVRGAVAGRGLRYDVAYADETLVGAALAGGDDERPFADPIYWAAFQVMGW